MILTSKERSAPVMTSSAMISPHFLFEELLKRLRGFLDRHRLGELIQRFTLLGFDDRIGENGFQKLLQLGGSMTH